MIYEPPIERLELGARDRFLLTLDHPEVVAHWRDCLFVAHGRRERLTRAAAGLLPGRLGGRLLLHRAPEPATAAAWPLLATLADGGALLRRARLDERRTLGWSFLTDYPAAGRGGGVAFLFDGAARPRVVLKLRRTGAGVPPLRREWETLEALCDRLPAPLQPSVPFPLAYREEAGLEVLATSWIPGRSSYVELHAALVPALRLAAHLVPAAEWLAAFQRVTRARRGGPAPAEEAEELLAALPQAWEGDRSRRMGWTDRLHALERIPMLARGAAHGDFWARNVLAGGPRPHGVGVVDWEAYREDAPPWRDLFHFPLSHALNYPWGPSYRRLPPPAALRRAFLGRGALTRQVGRYFARWAAAAGVPREALAPLLHLELLDRSRREAGGGGGEGDPWIDLHRRLARADRSVFSG
ncbi:MAG TPA: hypothetical protein VF121_08480 [Thermoanaerobaculia bacterium]|nr:hypothetical protein [Thermoanaerobaculia bacterium]